ncbi:hypothetical protein AWP52_26590 [Escherichia coli]|nr:hypothetical protein AWP52_26590 [Escherichia coli]
MINEVAEEIARLENLITAEEQVLSNLEVSRDGVEKAVTATAQRIAQFGNYFKDKICLVFSSVCLARIISQLSLVVRWDFISIVALRSTR